MQKYEIIFHKIYHFDVFEIEKKSHEQKTVFYFLFIAKVNMSKET